MQSYNSAPPAMNGGYQPPFSGYPQQQPPNVVVAGQPGEEPKKSKLSKIGGKVGNAAAGGLGFGAGAGVSFLLD